MFNESALWEKAKRYAILAARPEGENVDEMLYARKALEIEVVNAFVRGAKWEVSELKKLLEEKIKRADEAAKCAILGNDVDGGMTFAGQITVYTDLLAELDREKVCECGDHTPNENSVCDTCKLLAELDAPKKQDKEEKK